MGLSPSTTKHRQGHACLFSLWKEIERVESGAQGPQLPGQHRLPKTIPETTTEPLIYLNYKMEMNSDFTQMCVCMCVVSSSTRTHVCGSKE